MHNRIFGTRPLAAVGAVAVATTLLLLPAGCGDDDESSSSTTTTTATTTSVEDSGSDIAGEFPSDAFCAAQADLDAAQDGAQRNTAIGEMQNALGDDAPSAISDALDTLLTGDLTPEEYAAAEQTLAAACS